MSKRTMNTEFEDLLSTAGILLVSPTGTLSLCSGEAFEGFRAPPTIQRAL